MRSIRATLGLTALVGLVLTVTPSAAQSQDPDGVTFYKDVLPILQQNCQTCHRDGGG